MLDYEKEKEKKAFNEMTRKEKAEHIWEYYKFYIIGGIIGIIFIGSLLNTWVFNPSKKPSAHVMVIAPYTVQEELDVLKDKINKDLPQYSTDKKEIIFSKIIAGGKSTNSQYSMVEQQKFTAMLAARELDILIGDIEYLKAYAQNGTLMNLEEFYTKEELQNIKYEIVEESIVEKDFEGNITDKEEAKPYIIDITENESLKKIIISEKIGLAIVVNSERLEAAKDVAQYLIEL